MSRELTFSLHISIEGKEPVRMGELTPQEKSRCLDAMAARLSKNMSEYYSQHPEEYRSV